MHNVYTYIILSHCIELFVPTFRISDTINIFAKKLNILFYVIHFFNFDRYEYTLFFTYKNIKKSFNVLKI